MLEKRTKYFHRSISVVGNSTSMAFAWLKTHQQLREKGDLTFKWRSQCNDFFVCEFTWKNASLKLRLRLRFCLEILYFISCKKMRRRKKQAGKQGNDTVSKRNSGNITIAFEIEFKSLGFFFHCAFFIAFSQNERSSERKKKREKNTNYSLARLQSSRVRTEL